MRQIEIAGDLVTPAEVEASIKEEKYIKMGQKIAVCHLTLVDGFEVVGTAGVVRPDNYDEAIGNPIARKHAIEKVWQHLGSILQNKLAL